MCYICIEDNTFLFSKSFFFTFSSPVVVYTNVFGWWECFSLNTRICHLKRILSDFCPSIHTNYRPAPRKRHRAPHSAPALSLVFRTRLVRLFLWRIWFSYVILGCVDVLLMIKCSVTPLIPILRHFWYQDDNLYIWRLEMLLELILRGWWLFLIKIPSW